jgi:hypothetical protein
MADTRILSAITRFMTIAQIEVAYEAIFNAYTQRHTDVTVITGKTTDGDSAQAQIVISQEDFKEYMDAFETLLVADETPAGENAPGSGPVHTDHSQRYLET